MHAESRKEAAGKQWLLRLPRDEICELRIDNLTPPGLRPGMDTMWQDFLRADFSGAGTHTPWDMQLGAKNRAHAIAIALQTWLLDLDDGSPAPQ